MRLIKILTTTVKPNYPEWGQQTEMLPGWKEEAERLWKTKGNPTLLADLKWGVRLFLAAKKYDAVVTGFERHVWIFSLLRRLFGQKTPHIFLDAHPVLPATTFFWKIKRQVFRQIFLSATKVVTFSTKQRDLWMYTFKLPETNFAVVPYWATAATEKVQTSNGGYVFAGGDEERDYPTLIEAFRTLPYRLEIATLRPEQFPAGTLPPNVTARKYPHEEFMKLLAGASLVVVPLKERTIRYAGQQTYLNAMLLGKPVIVACSGADDYIRSGVDGIIVPPGDVQALRSFIVSSMIDKEVANTLAKNGQKRAQEFTPKRYFDSIFELVRKAV